MQKELSPAELAIEKEEWYEETFAEGQTPTFDDFVHAHIERSTTLGQDVFAGVPEHEITCIRLPDNHAILFRTEGDRVGKNMNIYCFESYLYEGHDCNTPPKAGAYTFIMDVPSGKEKDIFKAIDQTVFSEVPAAMFEAVRLYPSTMCRLFRIGLVGYCYSSVNSNESPAYRARLMNLVRDYVLPGHGASPFVMFYDAMPPGYHYPIDYMVDDHLKLSKQDQAKTMLMMEERALDEIAHQSWLRTKLKACFVMESDVSMAILDEKLYTEEVLFTFDEETGDMVPMLKEPREEPLPLSVYKSGRYKGLTAEDPLTPPAPKLPTRPEGYPDEEQ